MSISRKSRADVQGVFLASFHVRTGNTLSFVHPPELHAELSAAHAEWKALPSGSHAVERDTIFFALSPTRTAVAAFRNVALQGDDGRAQRGARMLSVAAVFPADSPLHHHLSSLDALADSIAAADTHDDGAKGTEQLLRDWLEAANSEQQHQERQRGDSFNHSALSHFPALSASLGPLLPPLLKYLATGHARLLIFSTAPLQPAASLAHNLADIVHAAQRRAGQSESSLRVRGLVTLHDIVALDDENRERTADTPGWIAFTPDKILLDKCALFDLVLDLTPLQGANGSKAAASPRNRPSNTAGTAASPSGAKPRFSIVSNSTASPSASLPQPPKLKPSSWTTHEYAEMRLVEDKAKRRLHSSSAFPSPSSALTLRAEEGEAAPTSPIPAADPSWGAARQVSAVRQRKASQQDQDQMPSQRIQRQSVPPTQSSIRTRPHSALQPRTRGVFLNLVSLLRYVFAQTLWFFPSAFWTPASASTSALTLLGSSSSSSALHGAKRRSRAISGLGIHSSDGASSLADSAFILPLGVRPDGGLRASVMLVDEDEDEDDDEDEENDEEAAEGEGEGEDEAGERGAADSDTVTSGQSTIVPSTSHLEAPSTPRGSQRLIDVDDDGQEGGEARGGRGRTLAHHAGVASAEGDYPGSPDPFLAAAGANSSRRESYDEGGSGGSATNLRVRKSRSSVSSSTSAARLRKSVHPSSVAAAAALNSSALVTDEDDEDGEGEGEEEEEDDEEELARALASSLRDEWTDWLAVLYIEITALVASTSPSSSSLAPVQLDGHDLASIGLSTRNGADCALVRAVGRGGGQGLGEVVIRTGWSWSAMFR